eukprot:TRINITY_DN7299_c0_g1_i1.p1 TRINITY_DN7299_c0_g1~~TRINITY_DN7299_c0_g1_i1.p1  ORF type:complete len:303 (-),score=31.61 TRINITY_DN7299_c0_g1_i1:409-1221(-)
MPIDYSRFDNIGSDDDDDPPPIRQGGRSDGGGDIAQLLRALQQTGSSGGTGGSQRPSSAQGGASGESDIWRQLGRRGENEGLDFDPYDGFGLGGDTGADVTRNELNMDALRKEAWQHLLSKMVTMPECASIASGLMLEAELHLIANRFRRALIAALALELLGEEATVSGVGSDGAGLGVADPLDGGVGAFSNYVVSSRVVQMVASYQLGDRDRAEELRETLAQSDRSLLSAHLVQRYTGTSEVLDLVPQFLNLMKAAEQNPDGHGGGGSG